MDPISLALLGISGVSSIFGGIAANDAAELNNQINLLNYYEQQAANQRARQEARRQQSEGKLGQTDAAGNRTYFIPGVGWVTDLTETQGQIQAGSEQEMLRQIAQGERDEVVQERAAGRRGREDTEATEAERVYRMARRPDEGALRQLFLARGAEERNRSADRAGNAVARQNIRAGGRNAAELVQGARAASDAEAARRAGVEAELMAEGEADRRYAADRDPAMALYDYFRKMSTSGTGPGGVFQPQGPQRTATGVADQGAINAAGRGAAMDYESPNFALASTLADLGAAGGGFYDRMQSQKYNQAMLDAFGRVGR